MNIKSFSPLQTGTTVYYPNSSEFLGTELMFSDDNAYLYCMVLRRNVDDYTKYDVVYYNRLDGYSGTSTGSIDYEYRVDLSNYIKIVHSDVVLETSGATFYANTKNPASDLYILLSSSNYMTSPQFLPFVSVKSNNDAYILASNLTSLLALQYIENYYNFIFSDYLNYISGSTFTTYFTQNYCENNYYYYGTTNPIENIVFNAKREKVKVYNRQNITYGKKSKILNIAIQDKYIQNTGFNITETQLFDMAKSPYLFTISGTTVEYWIIDDTTFNGFNTKTFGDKNIQLNLTKRTVGERYTGFKNNYYS